MKVSRKGWPKHRPRKLPSTRLRRATVALCREDLERMNEIRAAHPELVSDGEVLRWAVANVPTTPAEPAMRDVRDRFLRAVGYLLLGNQARKFGLPRLVLQLGDDGVVRYTRELSNGLEVGDVVRDDRHLDDLRADLTGAPPPDPDVLVVGLAPLQRAMVAPLQRALDRVAGRKGKRE